jgi:hypothetical protein
MSLPFLCSVLNQLTYAITYQDTTEAVKKALEEKAPELLSMVAQTHVFPQVRV